MSQIESMHKHDEEVVGFERPFLSCSSILTFFAETNYK